MKRGLFLLITMTMLMGGTVWAQQKDSAEPKVEIVKYSDFQCPACKYFVSIEEKLKEEYGDKVKITYKHFPLNMHEFAQLAARASEAAKAQGKFQEMHDLIFEGQEQWARGNAEGMFIGYAKKLDLNMDQFKEDLNSASTQNIVMKDKQQGLDLSVNSTPTFFINGAKLENNPRTYGGFKAIIESQMK